jgi:hypothetical protein
MSAFFAMLCILLLPLGQLTRFSLSPRLAFYAHDVAIVIFLLITTIIYRRQIVTTATRLISRLQKNHPLLFTIFLTLFIVIISWICHRISPTPILYTLRFFAYSLFIFYLATLKIITPKVLQNTILISVLILLLAGFVQYFIFPDAYWLKFLGWDEHYHRLFSTLLDPAFTGLIFVFAATYFLFRRQSWRLSTWLFFIALLTGLLLTYSRSSYLAFATMLILWVISFITFKFLTHSQPKKLSQIIITLPWRYFLVGFAVVVIPLVIFFTRPTTHSDSTNLLRTNSIVIRGQMFMSQLQSLQLLDFFIGRGLFVALPTDAPTIFATSSLSKITAAFPDNFFLLLISFFGLPLAALIIYWLIKLLIFLFQKHYAISTLLLITLLHAQFNNTFFQPFVYLYLGLFSILLFRR